MPINQWQRKPAPPGDENYSRVIWAGPSSYTQLTRANPTTTGDQIKASLFGANSIKSIRVSAVSASGVPSFSVIPFRLSDSNWVLKWVAQFTATMGGQAQTAYAEAAATTNLSAQFLVLEVIT